MERPFSIGQRFYYLNVAFVVVAYEFQTNEKGEKVSDEEWIMCHYFTSDTTLRHMQFPPACWPALKLENDRHQEDLRHLYEAQNKIKKSFDSCSSYGKKKSKERDSRPPPY